MIFQLPEYHAPDFDAPPLKDAPSVRTSPVERDGIAPEDYHATSIFPEYFKVESRWILPEESRMDCVPVVRASGGDAWVDVVEFRRLLRGDAVVIGRRDDGSDGIYVDSEAFVEKDACDTFAFRSGRSRETAYSRDYDELYELLRYERDHGHVVWVLGPAVAFDYDSRLAMTRLIEWGYVHALLAGNALATHDLEGALMNTALGQDIYTQENHHNGHYHHLDLLNTARRHGGIGQLIEARKIEDGIVQAALKKGVPMIFAGSIRDDGPLPEVIGNVYEAQDAMRVQARKATTVIALATQLHTIAMGNITPAYTRRNGRIRPVYLYTVDISEFAVNKLRDRGTLSAIPIVTNVQDFLVHLKNNLLQ
jgi:lysine-ketoglutarate reductase/saccharopine dehydrogenase-like protein (TIGR00300 family)